MKITELITYIKTKKKCITSFLKLFVNVNIDKWCIILRISYLHNYPNRSKHWV